MPNLLAPVAKAKFFTNNGEPAAGYKLFTYEAGTNTKLDTYPDANTGTPNTNPIILDFRGEANIWLPPNVAYKFIFSPPSDSDPPTAPIWSVDDIVDSQLITLWGGVDTGIANAYVLNFVANFTSYTDGIVIYWIPSNTNTGASTINVNGLGPVALINQDGTPLLSGQIVANQIAQILFNGTGFIVLSSLTAISRGSFLAGFTGFTSAVSGTIEYTRIGNIVSLYSGNSISGTSNSTAFTMTNLPSILRPSFGTSITVFASSFIDSGVFPLNGTCSPSSTGTVGFGLISTGFSNSGTKGIFAGWSATYSIV